MRPANTTLATLFSEVARSLIGFLVTLYLARELGASVLGAFFVVIALVVWLRVPMNAIGSAITKRVSEGTERGAFLGAGGALYALLTLVMALGILVANDAVNAHVGAPVAPFVAVLLVGNGFFSYVTNSLDGQKRVASSSVLKAAENIAEGGAQIVFVLLGYELVGLLFGQAVALLGGGAVGLGLFVFRPTFPGREHFESLMEYARYSWLGTVSGRTFGWMDTLVLSFFVGSGLIGVYEISWRLASVLILLGNAIQRTLFPEISDLADEGNESKIQFFLNEGLFYTGLLAIPGLFGAAVLGTKVLRIYGPEFTAGTVVLLVLVLARLVDAYGNLLLTTVNGLDRPDIAFRINGVFMVSNLVLNVGLVYLFGWYGAAVATAASSGITATLGLFATRRLLGDVNIPIAGIAKQVLASVAMAGIIVAVRSTIPITSMYHTIGYVVFGATVYGIAMLIISRRLRDKVISLLPEYHT
jgi:O-antigen/teichoic acid export membrane protein